ncbi:MAG: metallophosphoesterase family protein [Lachnospiraceae bacterium]|nr:metallophosphoesterase family protein [Lachnospiraceae bacterium]
MQGEPIRAAIISDTHGLLRPEAKQVIETCDVIIHAGDFDNQMLYHKLNIGQPLYAVRGNNDGNWAAQLPLVKRFLLGGISFIMAHDRSDLPLSLGKEQVVIFGHSHMYYQKMEDGRLWLNPGSCGYKRFTLPLSLAVMTIQDGRFQAEPVWLEEVYGKASPYPWGENERFTGKAGNIGLETGETNPLDSQQEESQNRIKTKQQERDQLFLIAKIIRFMKRGETVNWVADNLKAEPAFVETIYRISVTHPGADAHKILDKLEVNRLFS